MDGISTILNFKYFVKTLMLGYVPLLQRVPGVNGFNRKA